jgi:hypothetical protein
MARTGGGEASMRHSVPATGNTEALRARFIAEAIAAIGEADRYDKAKEALRAWLYTLAPFSRWGDFQGLEEITLPEPYHILVEPMTLYGYYRAWLRREQALSSEEEEFIRR